MKCLHFVIIVWFSVLVGSRASEPTLKRAEEFNAVDGEETIGVFIDVGKNDRVYARFSAISDSGAEVERVANGKIVWRIRCKPLGVAHSIYSHQVRLKKSGNQIVVTSHGSGGVFLDRLDLEKGKLVERTVK